MSSLSESTTESTESIIEQLHAALEASEASEANLRRSRHELRNDLQLINSLTAIQLRQVSDPRARAELLRCYQRIGSLGVVYQQSASASGVVAADRCLLALTDFYAASIRAHAGGKQLEFVVDADSLCWSRAQAVRIALILDDLLFCVHRHVQPPTPDQARVELELHAMPGSSGEAEIARLVLRGWAGLNPDCAMARAVAEQLGGSLEIRASPGGASQAVLCLPLAAEGPTQ
ncbi:hypothetical protein G6O69_28200 [Pseudenhygromyxa sp. WMMC2535]|uniref:histidine kinase dimerization/phosphoacceptor domain -containing protein n=1 Tax=Pseudenhygromyxa sp. WMMC2535 TaxID=2712867 RepID=UPI0015518B31|nr:histidine kinase dimerization/phosphoacceptor domain -containing protein [Pseudenhygromyxa sp. WMMC2535]NVB41749.1 hypothetical protein [Pseudenhygromyxa sp. WMMC2535]